MQTYKILSYDSSTGNHTIEDHRGVSHMSDLFVSGDFKDFDTKADMDEFAQSLVGKTISVDHIFPYISIASGVKVIEPKKEESLFEQCAGIVKTHAKAFYGINLEGGVK